MNPYNTPAPPRPWWRTTPAALGMLVLVALLGAFSVALGFLAMVVAMVLVWMLPPWRWFARLGSTFGAVVLLTVGAGIGGHLDDGGKDEPDAKPQAATSPRTKASVSPTAARLVKSPDYTGRRLDEAEKQARSAGLTTRHHDASGDARSIVVRSGWTVCFQKADVATKAIDFAAVRTEEPCPDTDGGPLPWPRMPELVGDTYAVAVNDLKRSGIDPDSVTLDDVYRDMDAPTARSAAEDGDEWRVCFQSPARGSEVGSGTSVRLDLGRWAATDTVRRCPATKDTTYAFPTSGPEHEGGDGTPARNPASPAGSSRSPDGGGAGAPARNPASPGGSSPSPDGGGAGTVHPGAYCSPAGATGVTTKGTPMVCGRGSDGRDRWHS